MSEETRDHIIRKGAELIHLKGFNNTGIQEILKAAEVPKGSFYFYFKNKEDFGLQVVDHFARGFGEMVRAIATLDSLSPLERIHLLVDTFFARQEEQGFTRGCPVGNLAQEMGDLNPAFRERLKAVIDGMSRALAQMIRQAQEAGELDASLDSDATGRFIISSWHGALVRMKVESGPEPLRLFEEFVFSCILTPQK